MRPTGKRDCTRGCGRKITDGNSTGVCYLCQNPFLGKHADATAYYRRRYKQRNRRKPAADQMPPGFTSNISKYFRGAEERAQKRLLAQLEKLPAPRCAYHPGHELVAVRQTRRVMCSSSPTSKTKQRTILRCPVPGCFYVAALPGENVDHEEAA